MCGICGVVQIGGEARDVLPPGVLDRMTDAMTHRGPDDRGTFVEPGVAFGARRLSVVDLADGHQPFANEDGSIWAAQNGELYNHRDLRKALERDGHRFRSRCDTEVLPHLYERHGTAFAEQLRGMFGAVVWDGRRRRAVVVRDRLGIKPMYYAEAGDLLVFASELKSLLASGLVSQELDLEALDAYLRLGYIPSPHSPLAACRKLQPGHRLVVEDGAVREERFWSYPEPAPGDPGLGIDHYSDGFLQELDESIRLRLMADVPLGAMLSGGLDSSVIVGLMAGHMTEPVKTFSVGFSGSGATNELADARLVSSIFGTDHHELELSFDEQAIDLADLTWHLDEPIADLSSLGFIALCGLAAEHVTVALSGQGADELLGGYLKHRAARLCDRWAPNRAAQAAAGAAARVAPRRARRGLRTLAAGDPATRLLAMSSKLDDALRSEIARGALAAHDGRGAERAVRRLLGDTRGSALGTTLYLDGQLALADDMLHYFDRTSMAHSLEVRVPFLDHHVVEYAATVPDEFKVRGRTTKALLKHAAAGMLPPEIIHKRKLGFFRSEVDQWFRAQARGAISDYLLAEQPAYAELLDRAAVARLVDAHRNGRSTPGGQHLLLAILMLEVWLSTYVPRATAATPSARETLRLAPPSAPTEAQPVYDVVTPVLNESANLPRLAAALEAQTIRPRRWTIVDTGSTDDTVALATRLAEQFGWVEVASIVGAGRSVRGRPIVEAIQLAGRASEAAGAPDFFVNVDADISFEPEYFERVAAAFAADPGLGIASGRCRELDDGVWRERHITRSCVWGAVRAYRWQCYRGVLPLANRLGWDGIDEIKANARGWRSGTLSDLYFRHHRPEGVRDGAFRGRFEQGRTAHYMGYRPWYLALRALRHAVREPAALAMITGYASAALRREPRCDDDAARAYLRWTQSPLRLPARALETFGVR